MDTQTADDTVNQAAAAWMAYLRQIRLDRLAEVFENQKGNLAAALDDIDTALRDIQTQIIDTNRGGDRGIRGFIAEVADCGIGNAREHIHGGTADFTLLNDNGPADLLKGATRIQEKFVQKHLSLDAVSAHLHNYPDFLKNGGKYRIPQDYYDKIQKYLSLSPKEATRLAAGNDVYSYKEYTYVRNFFRTHAISPDDIQPSAVDYGDVQRDTISATMRAEKTRLRETDRQIKESARAQARPTFKEGVTATAVDAAAQGTTAFVEAIIAKCRQGKSIRDFTQDDWAEIISQAGTGTFKGAVHGAGVYFLVNKAETPATLANALMTTAISVAEQAYRLRRGDIDETGFLDNCLRLCAQTAVSLVSSMIGQAVIPIPMLGPIIGNAIGDMLYKTAKDGLSTTEQRIIDGYLADIRRTDEALRTDYQEYIRRLNDSLNEYMLLIVSAFDTDPGKALEGSVRLAIRSGVAPESVLDTPEKIRRYFDD